MSQYLLPPPAGRENLRAQPSLQDPTWQTALAAVLQGEKTIEHFQRDVKQQLLETWPGQRQHRWEEALARREWEQELAEIKANEHRTEPVIIFLPTTPPPVTAAQPPISSDETATNPVDTAAAPASAAGSEDGGAENEHSFEMPNPLPAVAETPALLEEEGDMNWVGTGAVAEFEDNGI